MKTRPWKSKKIPAQQTAQVQSNLHVRAHSGFSDHFTVFLLVSLAGNRVWCSSSMPASSSKRRFILRAWKRLSFSPYAFLVPEVKGALSAQSGLPGAEKGRVVAQFLSTWWKSFAIYQDCNGIGGTGRFIPLGRVRFALLLSPLSIQSEAFLCAAVSRLSNEVRAEGANGSQIARGDLGSRTSVGYSL